jgi:hypothetical protein
VTNKQPQTPDTKISKQPVQPVKIPKPTKVEFDLTDEELEKVSGGGRGNPVSGLV